MTPFYVQQLMRAADDDHEQELTQQAHYDQLTGLPSRGLIMNQLEHAFEHARRQKRQVALLFLDVDNSKVVNDTMGHSAGDKLLRQASARLPGRSEAMTCAPAASIRRT